MSKDSNDVLKEKNLNAALPMNPHPQVYVQIVNAEGNTITNRVLLNLDDVKPLEKGLKYFGFSLQTEVRIATIRRQSTYEFIAYARIVDHPTERYHWKYGPVNELMLKELGYFVCER